MAPPRPWIGAVSLPRMPNRNTILDAVAREISARCGSRRRSHDKKEKATVRMREWFCNAGAAACFAIGCVLGAHANEAVLEKARALLAAGNPRQAFTDLAALQSQLSGNPE